MFFVNHLCGQNATLKKMTSKQLVLLPKKIIRKKIVYQSLAELTTIVLRQ